MSTNSFHDFPIVVSGTTVGVIEVGRGMVITVKEVFIKGESGNPNVRITTPKKIDKFLGQASFIMKGEGEAKVKFNRVTAIEVDRLDDGILVHGKIFANEKKGAVDKEIEFSEAPTDPKKGKAIVVLMD